MAALLLLSPIRSFAQKPAAYDFGVVQSTSPWLTCQNRAGLYNLPVLKAVNAQIDVQKADGGYKDPSESPDAMEGGVKTQTYTKVSEKVSFYGDMSYSYFQGKSMGGPVLMNPDENSINFYEYPDENIGTKTKELYTLDGGMSYRLNDAFSLGVSGHYQSGNYSKRKDPRNLNRWMELGLSMGIMNRFSESIAIGADIRYRRSVESISSRIYGVTGQNYFYFVDYGASLGKVEVLGSDNYFISSSTERPVLNNYFGGAIQIELGDPEEGHSFFNEFAYTRRAGSYGDKASSEILFSHNHGNEFAYKGVVTVRETAEHHIFFVMESATTENYLNSFSVLSNPGENLEVEYYGDAQTQARAIMAGSLGYEALIGGSRFRPSWRFAADLSLTRDDVEAYYYPYTRHQRADIASAALSATHATVYRKNIFEVGVDALFKAGRGDKASDNVLVDIYGPAPRTAQEYLDASWEFRTAAAAASGLSFTYTRTIRKDLSVFIGVKEKFGSLLKKPEYLDGRFRNATTISIGCNF
ncbi:MAG: hypothetical protein MJY83_02945 [Bacteroidales bacterium]|nr:hypothetical protein [Bacteroidales bacterium]